MLSQGSGARIDLGGMMSVPRLRHAAFGAAIFSFIAITYVVFGALAI